MDSTLSPPLLSLLSSTNTTVFSLIHLRRLSTTAAASPFTRPLASAVHLSPRHPFASTSAPALFHPPRCFSTGGGNGGDGSAGGGGGDGSEGGASKAGELPGAVDDVAALSPDAIILDVGGMTCGGCAAKVKKILENQPKVSSASVNLATETAIIWLAAEAKVMPNWQEELGEMLAKHLTNCGFESNLRGQGDMEGEIAQ